MNRIPTCRCVNCVNAMSGAQVGTRTDLRERTCRGLTVTGFDGVMNAVDVAQWLEMLYHEVGVKSATFHTGKYVPKSAGQIQHLGYQTFWAELEKPCGLPEGLRRALQSLFQVELQDGISWDM